MGEHGIDLDSQVNRTFQELTVLKDVQEVWGVLGPQVFNFMNDSANIAILQVGPPWRVSDVPTISPVLSPPAKGEGQGRACGARVQRRDVTSMLRTGPRDGKRGNKTRSAPCRPPRSLAIPQRLLQIQNQGKRQPGPRGLYQVEALQAFLDPSSGGYSWQDAYADVEHLVGILGRAMEVRGHPLGNGES